MSLALFCAGVAAGTFMALSAQKRASLFAGNAWRWFVMDDFYCDGGYRPWLDYLSPNDVNAEAL